MQVSCFRGPEFKPQLLHYCFSFSPFLKTFFHRSLGFKSWTSKLLFQLLCLSVLPPSSVCQKTNFNSCRFTTKLIIVVWNVLRVKNMDYGLPPVPWEPRSSQGRPRGSTSKVTKSKNIAIKVFLYDSLMIRIHFIGGSTYFMASGKLLCTCK